jgi:hypothetical protein
MTSRMLHAFDILAALDDKGHEIPLDLDAISSQPIAAPLPFPARFKVRSQEIGTTLEREYTEKVNEGMWESWHDAE